jgi:hypothetical protein|tara:strand:+ start:303 stop:431 length:129 start_codon:yes stop_codon:yes gene_type:complete
LSLEVVVPKLKKNGKIKKYSYTAKGMAAYRKAKKKTSRNKRR